MYLELVEDALFALASADVTVAQHRAFELAQLDKGTLLRLQGQADARPGQSAPIEALEKFLAVEARNCTVYDQLGERWQRAGHFRTAMRRQLKAVALAPRWDPVATAASLAGLAGSLLLLDEPESGLRLCKLGLTYDPYNVSLLTSLRVAAQRTGDQLLGEACHRYLTARRVGADPAGAYRVPDPEEELHVEPYRPDLGGLAPRSDHDLFRLLLSNRLDKGRPDGVRQRSLALALAANGRATQAYFVAFDAPAALKTIPDAELSATREALREIADEPALIDKGVGRYASYPDRRIAAVAPLQAAKHVGDLWSMLFDPAYEVTGYVIDALLALGVRDELRPLLDEATGLRQLAWQHARRSAPTAWVGVRDGDDPADPDDPGGSRRGKALVDVVVERIGRRTAGSISVPDPEPVPPEVLAALTFPGGLPLPPSLRHWLAFDAGWLAALTRYWDGVAFRTCTIAEAVRDEISPDRYWRRLRLLPRYPETQVLPLDHAASRLRFLLLDSPDDAGEYPVLFVDVDDTPAIGLAELGFDTWLARQSKLNADSEVEYPGAFEATWRRLFAVPDEETPEDGATDG